MSKSVIINIGIPLTILIIIGILIANSVRDSINTNKHMNVSEGVKIVVVDKLGREITLTCPKFIGTEPRGAHGRECYISNIKDTLGG